MTGYREASMLVYFFLHVYALLDNRIARAMRKFFENVEEGGFSISYAASAQFSEYGSPLQYRDRIEGKILGKGIRFIDRNANK